MLQLEMKMKTILAISFPAKDYVGGYVWKCVLILMGILVGRQKVKKNERVHFRREMVNTITAANFFGKEEARLFKRKERKDGGILNSTYYWIGRPIFRINVGLPELINMPAMEKKIREEQGQQHFVSFLSLVFTFCEVNGRWYVLSIKLHVECSHMHVLALHTIVHNAAGVESDAGFKPNRPTPHLHCKCLQLCVDLGQGIDLNACGWRCQRGSRGGGGDNIVVAVVVVPVIIVVVVVMVMVVVVGGRWWRRYWRWWRWW
jgi:hypothetical protein